MRFPTIARILIAIILIFCLVGISSAVVTQYNLTVGSDTVNLFNGTGVTTWTSPSGITTLEYLVVGGAGGGGSFRGAGGGSGGFLNGTTVISGATTFNITVGLGGLGGLASGYTSGNNGQNSSFANITSGDGYNSLGGGGGGAAGGAFFSGKNGGSGGGASHSGTPGTGLAGQGYGGGSGYSAGGNYGAGGGGGANNTGASGTVTAGGNGGNGYSTSITGSTSWYSGGGGGSLYSGGTPGVGGLGGGGNASWTAVAGYPGTNATGGGGGGGYQATGSVGYDGGSGGSGIVVLRYISGTGADFSGSPTSGVFPLPVTFTDLTYRFTPTDWNWTFGDGNYSAVENPVFTYNIAGTYTVILDASNVSVNATETKTGYITITAPAVPTPDFDANITSGKKPLVVQFQDLSTNLSYNPMSWDWSFGALPGNSTDKDPLRTFTNAGLYDINLIVTNDMGSNNTMRIGFINVSEYVGFTRQDLELSRGYNLTVYIRDEETRNLITDASVELSGTLTGLFNTTGGTYTTTSDYGVLVVRASAPGYYGSVTTYVMDQDRTDTIYLIEASSQPASTWFIPRSVTIVCTDYWDNPIPGLSVSATPLNFTAPPDWIETYYGIPSVNNLNGTTLTGLTASNGYWTAPMVAALEYRFSFTGAGITPYNITMYPSKDEYYIRIPTAGVYVVPTLATTFISYSFRNYTINSTHEFFNLTYQDTSSGTSTIVVNITNISGVSQFSRLQAVSGSSPVTISSGAIAHTSGETYTYKFSAAQAYVGTVNQTYTLTWSGLRTLGGQPSWVGQWLGIALLVLLAGAFALMSVRYAMILIPVITYFMTEYMQWIDPAVGRPIFITSLGALLVLGVLRYMRDQRNKLVR